MQMRWEFRTLRRFAVVFLSGGLVALIAELGLFELQASTEQTIYLTTAIALLTALDKFIRDHKDDREASLNAKVIS
jgi:hypothetical protein